MPFFAPRRDSDAASQRLRDLEGKVAAMDRTQAVIEYDLDGTVLEANANFLAVLGYAADEIVGHHHQMFVDPADAASPAYANFWATLNRGETVSGKFRRLGKGGCECWIQASYNPVLDAAGKPYKVTNFALDITAAEQDVRRAEAERVKQAFEQAQMVEALAVNLKRLSEGDLTALITVDLAGHYAQIKDDFNHAAPAMRTAIQSIVEASGNLRSGSADIARAADDLARRTEQQAASLEETAAALDEITATVRSSADGAQAASRAASSAKSEAETSGEIVRQAIDAMGSIDDSSRKISQIIGVIDEIAFQTNLLALNAGVEAARAGEAGKGFAVVASEVRALAQRSAEAAREIKALISSSATYVTRGVALVGDAGQALTKITGRVAEIDALILVMTRSAEEQATGLGQVNVAVNQMDQVTQQNAAMVEETNAAAATLRKEADELSVMVGRFKVGEKAAAPRPAQAGVHAPIPSPAVVQQARVQQAYAGGAATAVAASQEWEEF